MLQPLDTTKTVTVAAFLNEHESGLLELGLLPEEYVAEVERGLLQHYSGYAAIVDGERQWQEVLLKVVRGCRCRMERGFLQMNQHLSLLVGTVPTQCRYLAEISHILTRKKIDAKPSK
jgi:hypothetical protein